MKDQFLADAQGRRFSDVLSDSRVDMDAVFDFFADAARQQRLLDSEMHHNRPALAGVIKELEALPTVASLLGGYDGHTTTRFRQAIGVLTRIIMENHGWATTGRKGSLGKRVKVPAKTTHPGAYRNQTGEGLSIWFTRAERYQRPTPVKN